MIEAESAAMLVKAHALTQSAMAELFRIRAIDIANTGAASEVQCEPCKRYPS